MSKIPNFVVLDFETSGVSKGSEASSQVTSATSVAFVVLDGVSLAKLGEYKSLIIPYNLSHEFQPEAEKLTGLNKQILYEKGKALDKVVKEMTDIIVPLEPSPYGSILVGHNIIFDIDYLMAIYAVVQKPIQKTFACSNVNGLFVPKSIDTLLMARAINPTLQSYALSIIAKSLGIESSDSHDAMADVELTASVFKYYARSNANTGTGNVPPVVKSREGFQF